MRHPNLRPFQRGQSGNPKGRPKNEVSITYHLRELLGANDCELARALARRLIDLAVGGNMTAMREIFNRVDGPVRERVEITTNDGSGAPVEWLTDCQRTERVLAIIEGARQRQIAAEASPFAAS